MVTVWACFKKFCARHFCLMNDCYGFNMSFLITSLSYILYLSLPCSIVLEVTAMGPFHGLSNTGFLFDFVNGKHW